MYALNIFLFNTCTETNEDYWQIMSPYRACGMLSLWCSPNGMLFCSTTCGVYTSSDNAKTWLQREQGFTDGNNINSFAGDPTKYIFAGGWGVSRTTNLGIFWDENVKQPPRGGEVLSLYYNSKKNILFAGTDNAGNFGDADILKSSDFGASFNSITNGITLPIGKVYCIAPIGSDKIIIATQSGNYVSTDEGENWDRIFNLGKDWFLGISAIDDKHVFGGGSYLYESTNGGITWITKNANQIKGIEALIASPDGQIFVGQTSGISYSNDFGRTWTKLTSGLPSNAYIKYLMRDSSNYVYAGIYAGDLYKSKRPIR